MNLKDIRDAMYAQADWGPKTSPAADERMNKFINRAYNLISLEAPFLFFEDILRFATEPDIIPDSTVNTITFSAEHLASGITTANSWVAGQDNAGVSGVINWPTDRSWDGRVIEIKDNDNVWHRNIIRTVYKQPATPAVPAVPAVPGVQAKATITVELHQLNAFTAVGDKITLGGLSVPPTSLDLTAKAGHPVSGEPAWRNSNNGTLTADAIAGLPAPPPLGPHGGFNDPAGPFVPFVTAVSNVMVVTLTAVPLGTLGNPFTLTFTNADPSSAGALTVTNFSGGVDAVPEIPEIPEVPGATVISFWMPWDTVNFGAGPFEYRIYTEEYPLPDDIIEVRSTRLWKTNNSWPLQVLGQDDAERQNILDKHTDLAKGIPRVLFRRTHYQMPAPAVAPFVEPYLEPAEGQDIGVGWRGPAPAGTFEYKITYCWGARDIWFRNPGPHHWGANAIDPINGSGVAWDAINGNEQWGQQRYREPRWESAPSPISAKVSTTNSDHGGVGLGARLTLPNIEYIQGFYWNLIAKDSFPPSLIPPARDNVGFERAHAQKSGWFTRIYRRRVATNFDLYNALGDPTGPDPSIGVSAGGQQILHKIEEDNSFYLLAEIHIDPLNQGFFMDDGQLLPDYHRRLRDTHGYMNIALYPVPNKRYEIEVRCVRRPLELENDSDAPYIHAEACDILVDRALQLLYESEGNASMMGFAKQRYERNLLTLSKRYGDLRPSAVPVLKRLSRASPGYRTSIRYRQWWNTPTS